MAKKAASSTKKTTSSGAKKSETTVKTVSAETTKPATATRRTPLLGKLTSTPLLAGAIAEFIGTFLLTAVIVTQQNQPVALLFALVGIALVVAGISGAHVNPAISVASWVTRRITGKRAIFYVVAQFLGAMLAYVIFNAFVSHAPEVSPQMAAYGQMPAELFSAAAIPDGKEWVVLFAEFMGVAVLGFAYASALDKLRDRISSAFTMGAGLFIGMVLAGTAATYIGASVVLNPAASVALQVFKDTTFGWPIAIYFITPVIAAIIGFTLHDIIRREEA